MPERILTLSEEESCLAPAHSVILGLGARRLALFGSVRRGPARKDSDVDVLVEFEPGQMSADRLLALGDLLENLLAHPGRARHRLIGAFWRQPGPR